MKYFSSYESYREYLKTKGARNFRRVKRSIAFIDGVLVTVTRFVFNIGDTKMYGAIEPETGFFETSKKPIGKIS